jgi:hypothetical protein
VLKLRTESDGLIDQPGAGDDEKGRTYWQCCRGDDGERRKGGCTGERETGQRTGQRQQREAENRRVTWFDRVEAEAVARGRQDVKSHERSPFFRF